MLLAPNSPYWICVFWGCLLNGVIVVPLNIQSTPDFIDKIAKQTDAKLFFTHRFFRHKVALKRYDIDFSLYDKWSSNGENILDMASGPIQYKEYLEYSRNFKKRYCIDLYKKALDDAKKKIGNHGVFLFGSFFNIFLKEGFFDCAISLHTIYHIDKDKQKEAVRKLIRVIKPGNPVIIVYSNPHTIIRYFLLPLHLLRTIKKLLGKIEKEKEKEPYLYFFAHPIRWWDRFRNLADIQILPLRSFSSSCQKRLIPNNKFGKKMFNILYQYGRKVS